jgi:hypothetical protein
VQESLQEGASLAVGGGAGCEERLARVEQLQVWLASGRFAGRSASELGESYARLPSAELAIRIILADLAHYDTLSLQQRQQPDTLARRRLLEVDLQRLWERLG